MNRNTSTLPFYEIPPVFDSTKLLGSSRKVNTLKFFLESYLTSAKDPNALEEITKFLYQQEGGRRDHLVNSLQKKKMG